MTPYDINEIIRNHDTKHVHDLSESKLRETSVGSTQSSITAYMKNMSDFAPANSMYQMNRDFAIWCVLDLQPFNFVSDEGLQYFFLKTFHLYRCLVELHYLIQLLMIFMM